MKGDGITEYSCLALSRVGRKSGKGLQGSWEGIRRIEVSKKTKRDGG